MGTRIVLLLKVFVKGKALFFSLCSKTSAECKWALSSWDGRAFDCVQNCNKQLLHSKSNSWVNQRRTNDSTAIIECDFDVKTIRFRCGFHFSTFYQMYLHLLTERCCIKWKNPPGLSGRKRVVLPCDAPLMMCSLWIWSKTSLELSRRW